MAFYNILCHEISKEPAAQLAAQYRRAAMGGVNVRWRTVPGCKAQ